MAQKKGGKKNRVGGGMGAEDCVTDFEPVAVLWAERELKGHGISKN